jgi:hypothetical protein
MVPLPRKRGRKTCPTPKENNFPPQENLRTDFSILRQQADSQTQSTPALARYPTKLFLKKVLAAPCTAR